MISRTLPQRNIIRFMQPQAKKICLDPLTRHCAPCKVAVERQFALLRRILPLFLSIIMYACSAVRCARHPLAHAQTEAQICTKREGASLKGRTRATHCLTLHVGKGNSHCTVLSFIHISGAIDEPWTWTIYMIHVFDRHLYLYFS